MPSVRAAPPAGATAYRRWLASDVYTSSWSLHSPHLFCAHAHAISAPPRFVCKQLMSHMVVCLISAFASVSGQISITRSRGVTVSTLDPESSDRGSNPRETFAGTSCKCVRCESEWVAPRYRHVGRRNEGIVCVRIARLREVWCSIMCSHGVPVAMTLLQAFRTQLYGLVV